MADNSFLGTGMKFPPQINPATGRIMTSSGERSVKESIYLILMTRQSERLTRPEFGSRIDSYAFMNTGVTTLHMMRRELTGLILSQEPRIAEVDITIEPQTQSGRLIVNINYMIAGTNTRDNLVFPFYLNADSGAGSEGSSAEDDFEMFTQMDEINEENADDNIAR